MGRRSRRDRRGGANGSGGTSTVAAPALPPGLLVPAASVSAGTSYGGSGNGYDAVSASTMRGYIYWPQLDTRKEISSFTRTEIMRRARALTENVGLATHIIEGLADLLGFLTPMGATTDREWNKEANANFRDKQSIPEVFDAAGKFGFSEYQMHLNLSSFRDGDMLPVLTETSTGTARVATYEAHQIKNPYGVASSLSGWMDGVQINRFGRHLGYWLEDPEDRTKGRRIGANDAIYYGHFKKHGHIRPVSILRHAINHLVDMAEIVRDVKYGIKVRNQIPLTLETALGGTNFAKGATQSIVEQVRSKSVPAVDGEGTAIEQEIQYEQVMTGGNIPRLLPGQSLKAIMDAAPHPNQLALLDWMVRDISWGCGVAPEILWDINSLRGANNRLLNSKLQRWIGARLLRQRVFVQRFWVYHCAKEMKAGRLRECRDPQWWKVAMLPQASLTADRGKEGKLDMELVANRLMSLQTFFAKDGLWWLTEMGQMAEENEALAGLGLTVGDVLKRAGQADKQNDEEEKPPKRGGQGGDAGDEEEDE